MGIKIDFGSILAVYLVLLVLGVIYDQLIDWMMKRKYLEGYKFLAAGLGVLITVGMTAFFIGMYALLVLGAFVAIGMPLAGGEIWRYIRARENEQKAIRDSLIGIPNETRKKWGLHPLEHADPEASEYHWKTDPSPTERGDEL